MTSFTPVSYDLSGRLKMFEELKMKSHTEFSNDNLKTLPSPDDEEVIGKLRLCRSQDVYLRCLGEGREPFKEAGASVCSRVHREAQELGTNPSEGRGSASLRL